MDADVLIVGAGPTGLMLAGWLVRLGVRPLVIDRKEGHTLESRALATQARTLETYDMLGFADRAVGEGTKVQAISLRVRSRQAARAFLGDIGPGISPYPYVLILSQDRTEHLLVDHLREHGGGVGWNTAFEGLRQDDEGVSVDVRSADGTVRTLRARYACGCDGAGSPVRHALGLEFPGGTYVQRFFVVDALVTGAVSAGEVNIFLQQRSFHLFLPMPGQDHFRIVGIVPPQLAGDSDLNFEAIRPDVERETGTRVNQTFWFSTYNVHHRVASHFRKDRVFLLGDAGHIHSPAGGQGMNTGLMDAGNLGWKLAAVLSGSADDRLLASYEPERIAFARTLVNTTDRVFAAATSGDPVVRFLRLNVFPRLFAFVSRSRHVRRLIFRTVSQTRVGYRDSPISRGGAGKIRAGDRLPWVPWKEGGSNYDSLRALRSQAHIYGAGHPETESLAAELPDLAVARFPFTAEAAAAGFKDGAFYFVRPDGYVAFAASSLDPAVFRAYLRDAWGRS